MVFTGHPQFISREDGVFFRRPFWAAASLNRRWRRWLSMEVETIANTLLFMCLPAFLLCVFNDSHHWDNRKALSDTPLWHHLPADGGYSSQNYFVSIYFLKRFLSMFFHTFTFWWHRILLVPILWFYIFDRLSKTKISLKLVNNPDFIWKLH